MELTAELTKAFGAEMAKIFSGTISEEEIMKAAHDAFDEMRTRHSTYGHTDFSELEKAIASIVIEKILAEVKIQLESEEGKALIRDDAARIIKAAREQGEERLVRVIADHIASAHLPNTDMMGMASQIAYAIRNNR